MIVQPIGKFKLTYANGISQVKSLITQENYKSIVKPILDNIAELEAQRSGVNKKSKRYKEISEKLRELKKPISELGEFFTNESPLDQHYGMVTSLIQCFLLVKEDIMLDLKSQICMKEVVRDCKIRQARESTEKVIIK